MAKRMTFENRLTYGKQAESKFIEDYSKLFGNLMSSQDFAEKVGLVWSNNFDTEQGDVLSVKGNKADFHFEIKRALDSKLPAVSYYEGKTETFFNNPKSIYILYNADMTQAYCCPGNVFKVAFDGPKQKGTDRPFITHENYEELIKPIDEGFDIILNNKEWAVIKKEKIVSDVIKHLYTKTDGFYACIPVNLILDKSIEWFALHYFEDKASTVYVKRTDAEKVLHKAVKHTFVKSLDLEKYFKNEPKV